MDLLTLYDILGNRKSFYKTVNIFKCENVEIVINENWKIY